jgi:PAS domain S-box-containing protein
MPTRNRFAFKVAALWLIGAFASVGVGLWQQQDNATVQQIRFSALVHKVEADVRARMQVYEYGLRGARGAVVGAGGAAINRQRFHAYSQSRDLGREFPGSHGFGFIRRVPAAQRNAFVQAAQQDGAPAFHIRQLGPSAPELWVIQYIEPVENNLPAVGLDIASEPNRRAAAARAMEMGAPSMTAPITLVQANNLPQQSVLVLLPVYRADMPLDTVAERTNATLGWTYTPLALTHVLHGIEGTEGMFTVDLQDAPERGEPTLLYQTDTPRQRVAEPLVQRLHVPMFGREWRLTVQALAPFVNGLNQRSPLAVGLGLLAAWTALTLLWTLRRMGEHDKRALFAQQARLAAVVNGSNDAVVVKTLDGTITDWNAAAERIFGFPAQTAIGRSMAELVVPPDRQHEEADILSRVRRGKEVTLFDTLRQHRDGHRMDVTVAVSPIVNQRGETVGAASVMRDISTQKAAEKRILELNTALSLQVKERAVREQVLLEQALSSIIVTDARGQITLFNPVAEKLLGYKAGEVIGTAVMSVFHDAAEVKTRVRQASAKLGRPLQPGEVFLPHVREAVGDHNEWLYVHKDGTRIPVLLTVGALRDAQGQLTGFIGIAADLRERKRLERALTSAVSASAAKDMFLANMSHEVRTPLNAVIGLTFLLEQTPLSAEQRDLLNKVQWASKGLLAVINDVLDLSKIAAGEMQLDRQPFDLEALLRNALSLAEATARPKGLRLNLDLPHDLPPHLLGDALRLQQVLGNLLTNAVKFTERGTVCLNVSVLPAQTPQTACLRLAVQDTGMGIPPEVQAMLFTPFVQGDATITRHFGGTGLGLSIVRRLVGLMGGEVGVVSEPGRGSEFWFTVSLPVVAAPVPQLPPAPPTAIHSVGGRLAGVCVLLVDDSDINREVGQRILAGEGAHVVLAENGQQAIDLLGQTPERIHVVLMDLHMPVMDGHTATQHIRGPMGLRALPIVALTASPLASARAQALNAGMNGFLSKPLDPQTLLDSVQRLAMDGAMARTTPGEVWPATHAPFQDPAFLARLVTHLDQEHRPWLNATQSPEARLVADDIRAKLHKLMGSAGMLGLTQLHLCARQAHDLLETEPPQSLRDSLHTVAEALRNAVSHTLAPTPPAPAPDTPPLPPTDWNELLQQLQRHNLAALDSFQRMRPQLAAQVGADAMDALDRAMGALDFAVAAQWLLNHPPDGPPPAQAPPAH